MKIAFVHDRIVSVWWAEKVFFDLIKKEQFKEAKIFTVFSNKKKYNYRLKRNRDN